MTVRAWLERRSRWAAAVLFTGVGLVVAVVLHAALTGQPPDLLLLVPAIVLVALLSLAAHYLWFRCPWCRGNMAPLFVPGARWVTSRPVCYCPYCGGRLDEELADEPAADAGAYDDTRFGQ